MGAIRSLTQAVIRRLHPTQAVLALSPAVSVVARRRLGRERFDLSSNAYPGWIGDLCDDSQILHFQAGSEEVWVLGGTRGLCGAPAGLARIRLTFLESGTSVEHSVEKDVWMFVLPKEAAKERWQLEFYLDDGRLWEAPVRHTANLWEYLGSHPETPDGEGWTGYAPSPGSQALPSQTAPAPAETRVGKVLLLEARLYGNRVALRWVVPGGLPGPSGSPRPLSTAFEEWADFRLTDDVGTRYVRKGSAAGGRPFEGETTYVPAVPAYAKKLIVEKGDWLCELSLIE
jgi:hypothetical protein